MGNRSTSGSQGVITTLETPKPWASPGSSSQRSMPSSSRSGRRVPRHYRKPVFTSPSLDCVDDGFELRVDEEHVHWQKGELLGTGAFGMVYLGLNSDTGEIFAAKQVPLVGLKDQEQKVATLEAEIELMKDLKHTNIVRYFGTQRDGSFLTIFMEYVPGGSIAALVRKFGPLNENLVRVYARQILLGLQYLHSNRIIHRDIKGANILVDKGGVCKLADFGASKRLVDLSVSAGRAASLRGTPFWMAPEVVKQTGHGVEADIWSVGCTVVEMAAGAPPWSHFDNAVAAMYHIASTKEPPPLPDHLSPEAIEFLTLCFRRDPEARPTASQLLRHSFLDVCKGGRGASPAPPALRTVVPSPMVSFSETHPPFSDNNPYRANMTQAPAVSLQPAPPPRSGGAGPSPVAVPATSLKSPPIRTPKATVGPPGSGTPSEGRRLLQPGRGVAAPARAPGPVDLQPVRRQGFVQQGAGGESAVDTKPPGKAWYSRLRRKATKQPPEEKVAGTAVAAVSVEEVGDTHGSLSDAGGSRPAGGDSPLHPPPQYGWSDVVAEPPSATETCVVEDVDTTQSPSPALDKRRRRRRQQRRAAPKAAPTEVAVEGADGLLRTASGRVMGNPHAALDAEDLSIGAEAKLSVGAFCTASDSDGEDDAVWGLAGVEDVEEPFVEKAGGGSTSAMAQLVEAARQAAAEDAAPGGSPSVPSSPIKSSPPPRAHFASPASNRHTPPLPQSSSRRTPPRRSRTPVKRTPPRRSPPREAATRPSPSSARAKAALELGSSSSSSLPTPPPSRARPASRGSMGVDVGNQRAWHQVRTSGGSIFDLDLPPPPPGADTRPIRPHPAALMEMQAVLEREQEAKRARAKQQAAFERELRQYKGK